MRFLCHCLGPHTGHFHAGTHRPHLSVQVVRALAIRVFAHVGHAADEDDASGGDDARHGLVLVELLSELLVVDSDRHL